MNEPRPAMISARPPESRSTSANCWNTRTGSSELSTVTALASRIRSVRTAIAAEHDGRRGDEEVGAVVLADREHVEPELVGQLGLLEQVAHPLLGADTGRKVREGGKSEFHLDKHSRIVVYTTIDASIALQLPDRSSQGRRHGRHRRNHSRRRTDDGHDRHRALAVGAHRLGAKPRGAAALVPAHRDRRRRDPARGRASPRSSGSTSTQRRTSRVWRTVLSIRIGGAGVSQDLQHWVNNGLMTFFFLVVGLEARREFDLGELRDRRRLALPAAAALGGMVVPIAIYLAFNAGRSSAHGWGAAMSTDTAFALGMLALVGRRFPQSLRAFILTVAVADDLVAFVVIATAYSQLDEGRRAARRARRRSRSRSWSRAAARPQRRRVLRARRWSLGSRS